MKSEIFARRKDGRRARGNPFGSKTFSQASPPIWRLHAEPRPARVLGSDPQRPSLKRHAAHSKPCHGSAQQGMAVLNHVAGSASLGLVASFRESTELRAPPVDGESDVFLEDAVLGGRSIVITAFVEELNCFRQGHKRARSLLESRSDFDFWRRRTMIPFPKLKSRHVCRVQRLELRLR